MFHDRMDAGRHLAAALSDLQSTALPVVILTDDDAGETELQALDAGADDCLRKSTSLAILLGRIRRILLRLHLARAAG